MGDQLLTFVALPGKVDMINNACERDLRPAVVQRKVTNGYRAMGAAKGEADMRIVVATAALQTTATPFATLLATIPDRTCPRTRMPTNTPWVITAGATEAFPA